MTSRCMWIQAEMSKSRWWQERQPRIEAQCNYEARATQLHNTVLPGKHVRRTQCV